MMRLLAVLMVMFCGSLPVVGDTGLRPVLQEHRLMSSDLEIRGLVQGIPTGGSQFVSRKFLESLPKIRVVLQHDANFPEMPSGSMVVGGLYLDALARALGARPEANAVQASCSDGYAGTFPPEYIREHRPILVLTMDGLSPHEWAKKNHKADPGPYFITYQDFTPAFHVLAHEDRPAIPVQVVRLEFQAAEAIFGGITPKGLAAENPEVMQGYRIAQQNCYRCHHSGGYGGTMAKIDWSEVGAEAKQSPKRFETLVRDPSSINPKLDMTPNPQYDQATLHALTRYFETFSVKGN